MSMTLKELAGRIGAELRGDGEVEVEGCAGLDEAGPSHVSFFVNRKYIVNLSGTGAAAVILAPGDADRAGNQSLLLADNPYFAFREAVVALHGFREHPPPGVSKQAIVDPSAGLGRDCCIQPMVFVAGGASIGDRCVIYPHCFIGPQAIIGDGCILYPNVTVYDRCVLGSRVIIHAGTVIGQDGFGHATHNGDHHKIPQIGNVVIEDDVELGANCAVDRATVGSTRIGMGSKLSDLVTIGHGAHIGPHNLLVAQVGVAGSANTGERVSMGGQVGVAGHLKIGDGAQIAAKAGVMTDVPPATRFGGQPAVPLSQAKRHVLALAKLPDMIRQLKKMEKRVAELEAKLAATNEYSA